MKQLLLIVTDPALDVMFRKILAAADVDIRTTMSQASAELRLRRENYDIVVADLPTNGDADDSLLRLICRVKSVSPGTETIVIAGGGSARTMERAQECGVAYYFEAPVPTETLCQALAGLGVVWREPA